MPFISEFKHTLKGLQYRAGGALAWIVGALSPLRAFGFGAGLILTLASGAWLAMAPGSFFADTYLHARTLHLVAGFVITLGLAYEIGRGIVRTVSRLRLRRKVLNDSAPPTDMEERQRREYSSVRSRMLGAAYWILLGLLLISGFEVWIFLNYHVSPIPILTPLRWRIVHYVTSYYFGAAVLLIFTRYAAELFVRLRAYLMSP